MMKKLFVGVALLFQSMHMYAQSDLYMPLEIQNAYKNQTRSYDGKPGVNYWQNFSSYDIEVEIEPGTWKITGSERVVYSNKSPDSLSSIIIKMLPNHYKKGAARSNVIPLEDLTDGMQITSLKINDQSIELTSNTRQSELTMQNGSLNLKNKNSVEIRSSFIKVNLAEPIPPDDSVVLFINWSTEIPPVYVNRIGAYDQESAFMGYWYPQIGVYDDIDGWDEFEYLGSQEYYCDFADYKVKITVPDTYKVWATGSLTNPEKVLTRKEFSQYQASRNSSEKVVIDPGGKKESPESKKSTWIFKASNVRDFAAGISNNFRWEASSMEIGGSSVSSNLVYDEAIGDSLRHLLRAQNESLLYLSNTSPGVDYPYSSFTTFMGVPEYDGMEFPMLANNGYSTEDHNNVEVTFHELAHSYFPFLVGINEVKYSWMEEGWATFFTIKFIQHYYKNTEHENSELNRILNSYLQLAGHHWESPLFAPSNHLVYRPAHRQLAYRKPAFLYLALEDLLGEKLFLTCLKEYINRWAGKHPSPYDFMFTFNDVSNQNLNWVWQSWVFDYGYADLALTEIADSVVKIENVGRLPVPVSIKFNSKNGEETMVYKSASVWKNGDKFISVSIPDIKSLDRIELITDKFPDIDSTNNVIKLKSD